MKTHLKKKIEKFCYEQLCPTDFPKTCHVFLFSADVPKYRFNDTLYKFHGWEMYLSVFYLDCKSLFLKYSENENFSPRYLIRRSFERTHQINTLTAQLGDVAEQVGRLEERLAKEQEEKEKLEKKMEERFNKLEVQSQKSNEK